jgi:hypothetical protein
MVRGKTPLCMWGGARAEDCSMAGVQKTLEYLEVVVTARA